MATRSGKRIHRSFQEIETKVDTEFNPKSERKTRRRVKESNDDPNTSTTLRKRVRYPSDETNDDETEIVTEKEIKTARKMLRNTLRERDVNVMLNALEEDDTTKVQRKSTRLARRTKKLDDTVQPMDFDNDTPEDDIEKPKKKRNKAKVKELEEPVQTVAAEDVIVIAKKKSKKSKKKGKKNSSVNEIRSVKNRSVNNMSVDSFHSADGSPLKENFNDEANAMSLDYQIESEECPKSDRVEPENFENSDNALIDNKENNSTLKKKMTARNSVEKNLISTISSTILSLTKDKCSTNGDMDSDDEKQTPIKRKSSLRNSKFDKNNLSSVSNSPLEKGIPNIICDKKTPTRKSSIRNSTFDKVVMSSEITNCSIQNIIFDNNTPVKRRSSIKSSTFDKIDLCASATESLNSTSEKINPDITYEKNDITKRNSIVKSYLSTSLNNEKNSTFDKIDLSASSNNIKNSTFDKTESDLNSSVSDGINIILYPSDYLKPRTDKLNTPPTKTQILSSTPDKSAKDCVNESESQYEQVKDEAENKSHDLTCDKNPSLNSTYDKIESKNATEKILIHSSDSSDSNCKINMYLEKPSETFTLSTTSDECKTENILNTTPLLVESSMEDSSITTETINMENTPDCLPHPGTQMKRESTFTKDTPEVSKVAEPNTPVDKTPSNYLTVPSPGYTPFHTNHKSSHKKKTVLNVTHSLEKSSRKSSLVAVPKTTKVMFCSPVDITGVTNERKTKVVKSSMKGSNKSFVFDDSVAMSPMELARAGRKRSYTHSDVEEARVKRKRLGGDMQLSVDRLSKPRGSVATATATAQQPEPATPPRKVARPQCKSETKAGAGAGAGGARTRLPNFAALHQRRFERMESLDEFKRRRERRARRLLTPTGAQTVRERSPRETAEAVEPKPSTSKKIDTPVSTRKLPSLESLRPGYTRFGFKIDYVGNPFTVPPKSGELKAKEIKANRSREAAGASGVTLSRKLVLPSRAGVTSVRKEAARCAAMKEKPCAAASTGKRDGKRNEYRTIIKGVRTNRRFELQMKSRNVDG